MNYKHPFVAMPNVCNQFKGSDNQLGAMPAFVGTIKSKIPGMTNVPDSIFVGACSCWISYCFLCYSIFRKAKKKIFKVLR